jgi:lipopolysaccharide transport protein LptA
VRVPFPLLLIALWAASAAGADADLASPSTAPADMAAPAADAAGSAAGPGRFGIELDRKQPLEIRADEFEAAPGKDGGKHFTFRKHVEVVQADLRIRAERLDAHYPPKAKDPERLVASGSVVVIQGDREAHCDSATYLRASDSLVCSGEAELRDGKDRVRGQRIEFDLASEIVTVTGGAELELHPRAEDAAPPAEGEGS